MCLADQSQFASDADVLDLGSLDLAGDPTFFNMGDIGINGNITVGQSLAILATGNVTATNAVVIRANDPLLGGQNSRSWRAANSCRPARPQAAPPYLQECRLQPGQTIQVRGGSPSGGTISLANSTIDTSADISESAWRQCDSGCLRRQRHRRHQRRQHHLEAALVPGQRRVTLIAGGTVGSTNTAISGIAINASGGTGMPLAAIGIFAAQPMGSVGFDSTASRTAYFHPVTLTHRRHSARTAADSGGQDIHRWWHDYDQDRRVCFPIKSL